MKALKAFLKEMVVRSGLSRAEISRLTRKPGDSGVTETSLSNSLNGKRGLTPETIEKLAPVLKLSNAEKKKMILLAIAAKSKGEAEKTLLEIVDFIENSNTLQKIDNLEAKTEVPVWAEIRAGTTDLSESDSNAAGVTGLTQNEIKEGYFCMKISGDSMKDELIFNGDIGIFAPHNQTVNDQDIYAIEVEGYPVWLIKKICRLPNGKIALVSANADCKNEEIDQAETRISVKGRLIRTVRERGKNFNLF
jgi:SOS-response transcriptional repressor LexA